ncbi:MAG: hypothetical protein EBQ70_06520 [Betaproteobacteria bacterium]|nr:hypothetical protein [Betaproteobacteria bacterium]
MNSSIKNRQAFLSCFYTFIRFFKRMGFVWFVWILSFNISFANSSNCYAIKNTDAKNFCLAISQQQASYCYSIRESDDKNMCLAQVKKQKSSCYSIKSSDQKNQCLALVP